MLGDYNRLPAEGITEIRHFNGRFAKGQSNVAIRFHSPSEVTKRSGQQGKQAEAAQC